ncbi:hypothetical protein BXT86_02805 [candidate division WOR-3 bacterium 4484_100]|uniref:non-specific serine/threonine protein kinase n=1 Tax=candidate division WOR-3 bacterium 4484_100 TaxID=1936077 RepID=A0A1V4QFJ3_UNCW3|nr:MAG: hypothetical protein BXT86_02805 [candidate division WOR-3 bacterium 4484_100]
MKKTFKYIGNYKLIDIIGKGGMARVYTAVQMPLNRVVVVKEMNRSIGGNLRQRFKQEAMLSATLNHKNIVPIYDYFNIGSSNYLVMEYVDGLNLAEVIEMGGPLHPVITGLISYEICQALDYAHRNGIIHRDIKPTNILLSNEGEVKISDFGVAKAESSPDLTATGVVIGTPFYMSPEQASGKKVTYQSDIYSLAIVMYEMVTGKKPFTGENAQEITVRVSKGKYKSPLWLDPHHSLRLSRIINRAMKKKLRSRYKSMSAMARDLERFLGWKNLAQSQKILKKFLAKLEYTRQATTLVKKPKRKKKRHTKKENIWLYIILVVILLLLIFYLVKIFLFPV